MSAAHPGFAKVAASVARRGNYSPQAAARIVAAASRNASAAAKRRNPRLKRVAGKKK